MKLPKQAPTVIKIPAPFHREGEIGLGDAIKHVTTSLGVRPCGPCQSRAEALNRLVVFSTSRTDR